MFLRNGLPGVTFQYMKTKPRPPQKTPRRDKVRDRQIVRLWATGKYTKPQLGELFGVTRQRIHQILKRST